MAALLATVAGGAAAQFRDDSSSCVDARIGRIVFIVTGDAIVSGDIDAGPPESMDLHVRVRAEILGDGDQHCSVFERELVIGELPADILTSIRRLLAWLRTAVLIAVSGSTK